LRDGHLARVERGVVRADGAGGGVLPLAMTHPA
jgi:hypothetical protein